MLLLLQENEKTNVRTELENVSLSSSSGESDDQEAPVLYAFEADGTAQFYLQNKNFNKPQFMTLFENVSEDQQFYRHLSPGKK